MHRGQSADRSGPTRNRPTSGLRSADADGRPRCALETTPTCSAPEPPRSVFGHRVMAPSTFGTFLRSFTFGHCRQMEAVIGHAFERAWAAGAGPGDEALVIDIDSTICEVDGNPKQGAEFGYTHVLGYHPLLATRADTGEVLHARMRKGSANTQRGRGPVRRRAGRPCPPRRRRRRADRPGRFRVLVEQHDRRVEPARRALHDGRALWHERHC